MTRLMVAVVVTGVVLAFYSPVALLAVAVVFLLVDCVRWVR